MVHTIYATCRLSLFFAATLFVWQPAGATDTTISYSTDLEADDDRVILDTRQIDACLAATLPDSRCLPALDFLGPHRRLANFSGLLWRLGTAGLTGDEHVLVIGNKSTDKEFMAGLLYLAGQRQITLLTEPVASRVSDATDSGVPRSTIRENIFQSRMRSDLVVLRSELAHLIQTTPAPRIIDGRSEMEYLGKEQRATRGGHVPGAQHYPLDADSFSQISSLPLDDNDTVAYSYDAYTGLVYLARLIASNHRVRIYLEGWAGWASDGALPADNLTFPPRRVTTR